MMSCTYINKCLKCSITHKIVYPVIFVCIYMQGYGNIEPTTGHFDLFSSLLSCSPYTLYTQFTGQLLDNVLHVWLFPHHCIHVVKSKY